MSPFNHAKEHAATQAHNARTAERLLTRTPCLAPRILFSIPFSQRGIVEQLPKKIDRIVFCELRPSQKRAYGRLVSCPDTQVR